MIKQLSINNEVLNIDNLAKLDSGNVFDVQQVIRSEKEGPSLKIIQPEMDITQDSERELRSQIWFTDSQNRGLGVIQHIQTGNYISFQFLYNRIIDRQIQNSWIGLGIIHDLQTNQISVTSSNQPNIASNNSEIATTSWVRQLLASKGIN